MDAVLGKSGAGMGGYRLIAGADRLWPEHQARVMALLEAGMRR